MCVCAFLRLMGCFFLLDFLGRGYRQVVERGGYKDGCIDICSLTKVWDLLHKRRWLSSAMRVYGLSGLSRWVLIV